MGDDFRILPAGDAALVVEFADRIDPAVNARALSLAKAVARLKIDGVLDVVPTYRSVAVYFDPVRTNRDAVAGAMGYEAAQPASVSAAGAPVRIPVCYGGALGPDLADVAAWARLSEDEVVALHSSAEYRVFMLGFVPGFAYLGTVDARVAMPRHSTPRVRVPAGSVGIAGFQTGIYPCETPGGWQIVGQTPFKLFDGSREAPFLLEPGDTVRFYPIELPEFERLFDRGGEPRPQASGSGGSDGPCLCVIRPGLLTTVQDRGRWGWQSFGVPVAGPMDPYSHRMANVLVGNDADAATLEVSFIGPEIEFEDERVVALTGADFALTVDRSLAPSDSAFPVAAGARLRFGERRHGSRAYLAVSGGIGVPPTFGSRSTHLGSRMGGLDGRALRAGDRVPLGSAPGGRLPRLPTAGERDRAEALRPQVNSPTEPARVRVLPGPQHDRFADRALDTLQSAPYKVGLDSNRMGFRLEGPVIRHADGADIISDATPLASLQVPASGQPLLLMADRQTTGGYPKIATVITADVGIAGQLAPGDAIRFEVCTMREALAALVARESAVMALERPTRHG